MARIRIHATKYGNVPSATPVNGPSEMILSSWPKWNTGTFFSLVRRRSMAQRTAPSNTVKTPTSVKNSMYTKELEPAVGHIVELQRVARVLDRAGKVHRARFRAEAPSQRVQTLGVSPKLLRRNGGAVVVVGKRRLDDALLRTAPLVVRHKEHDALGNQVVLATNAIDGVLHDRHRDHQERVADRVKVGGTTPALCHGAVGAEALDEALGREGELGEVEERRADRRFEPARRVA
eukprot:scaffold2177_cov272-Pinguiococcus_pyrenoidosus.AAC.15